MLNFNLKVKGALQYDELGPKQKYIRKLLVKAWKNPKKTDKFYQQIMMVQKDNKRNTIINLKILVLLHNYFKKGPSEAIICKKYRSINPDQLLEDIRTQWEGILNEKSEKANSKDPKRSIYSTKLIVNMSTILLEKLKLNKKYSEFLEGNFSLNPFLQSVKETSVKFKPLNPYMLFDLFSYLDSLLHFTNANLLQVGHLWNLQACIALSLLDEIYCLICLIVHLYKTFKLSTNFESDNLDADLIRTFIEEKDSCFERMYIQANKLASRCGQITETVFPVASMIPKLPLEVVEYIKNIELLTNSYSDFNIFHHLNYSESIYGLKLPLSFGPLVADAVSSTNSQSTAADKLTFNSYPICDNQKQKNEKIFQNKGQNFSKEIRNTQCIEKQILSIQEKKESNVKLSQKDGKFSFWPGQIDQQPNLHQDQLIEKPTNEYQQENNEIDLFALFNQEYLDNNRVNDHQQNYIFHPSHPALIQPDQKPQTSPIQPDLKGVAFDIGGGLNSFIKAESQIVKYDFSNSNNINGHHESTNPFDLPDTTRKEFNIYPNTQIEPFNPSNQNIPPQVDLLSLYQNPFYASPSQQYYPQQQDVFLQFQQDTTPQNQKNPSLFPQIAHNQEINLLSSYENIKIQNNSPLQIEQNQVQPSQGKIDMPKTNQNTNQENDKDNYNTSDSQEEGKAQKYSENIPEDEGHAKCPLDSFLANGKEFRKNQMPISPSSLDRLFEGQKKEQRESLMENHWSLINYIQNSVSKEFLNFIVDFSQIQFDNKIGSGNSCEVFKGICKGVKVAIKVIHLDDQEEAHLKEFQREIEALIKLKNHPNLLQLVAISSSDNNFYIMTEFCQGGNLFELLHRRKGEIKIIPWAHSLIWLKEIARAMDYLHKSNLIHRDLKSLKYSTKFILY